MNNYLPSAHRGLFSLYSLALVSFFSIAIVMAIIIINVGFLVSDSQLYGELATQYSLWLIPTLSAVGIGAYIIKRKF